MLPIIFFPYPYSYLKHKLASRQHHTWQQRWDLSEKGRFTYNFLPKVQKQFQIINREIVIFLTNHGPFQEYFFKIGKRDSPLCICSHQSNSLHYILSCPLTKVFHIRKDNRQSLSNWFSFILKKPHLQQKIIKCIQYLEKNEADFRNLNPYHPDLQPYSSSDED